MGERWWEGVRFRLDVNTENPPKIKGVDFNESLFCRALSLTLNVPIHICVKRRFLAEDALFNLSNSSSESTPHYRTAKILARIGKVEIDKVKDIYETLTEPSSKIQNKLKIPVDRWIRSKFSSETSSEYVNAIIDLGIALESIYLSDRNSDRNNNIAFPLRLRAAWYLGKDKGNRRRLMDEANDIYDWRCSAVHKGILPKKTKKTPFTNEADFLARAQDLCRDSILKIVEDGKFPDWGELILGE